MEKESKWNEQQVSCGSFEGILRVKESVLNNGDLHTHIIYSLSDGEHAICGIGNDITEIQKRIAVQIGQITSGQITSGQITSGQITNFQNNDEPEHT